MPRHSKGARLPRPVMPERLPSMADLRVWGEEHGWEVGERGQLPFDLQVAYLSFRLRARRRLMTQGFFSVKP